ncbi:MAG: 4Fe-4S binding protein [Rhodospirillales bacterium]
MRSSAPAGLLHGRAACSALPRNRQDWIAKATSLQAGRLLADGSIRQRQIRRAEVAGALSRTAYDRQKADAPFVDLFAGLITPPRIGQNLLGKRAFDRLAARLGADEEAILVAANGLYSFKGTGYVRSGRFDRVQLVQGSKTFALTTAGYRTSSACWRRERRNSARSASSPSRAGRGSIRSLPGASTCWSATGRSRRSSPRLPAAVPLPARPRPAAAVAEVEDDAGAADVPLWQETWWQRWPSIAAMALVLAALTVILVMQDQLAARPRLHRRVRLVFLTVTLVWIGWIAGAQLSVVNVLTFAHALMSDFRWEFFLLDPLIFPLWSYVALSLLFWGRGVFCGWLCPFGALQELISEAARRLRIRQLRLPFILHERLWPLKYLIFLGLFAVSLNSMNIAFVGAEVEPFKTAISLKFVRAWPFVVYAGGLLVASLFIERFFCRYLCPLGAALAIPARIRTFEWLKRHPQCGRECSICEHRCPVQAIHPSGAINPNECIYCLKCQTLYF